MDKYLAKALGEYGITETQVKNIEAFGGGHINRTYRVITDDKVYLLQQINHKVFKNPEGLMDNFAKVTEYIKGKISEKGGDPERETLTVIKTVKGENFTVTENGEYFRLLIFIDAISINESDDPKVLNSVASGFGKFQNMLAAYPAETLFEVIPDFHNTSKRYEAFEQAVSDNLSGRLDSVSEEIEYVRSMKDRIGVIVDGIADGSIPLRVTHNDTKLNNALFDKDTKECICVIDLDTVMSGSYLYDYGDALRFAGSSAAEDETDLARVYFDMEKFSAFTKGYLSEVKDVLCERELELLPFSVELMTFECGMRFLTDYLNGDTYFRIHYADHNRDRARNQFKLSRDIDSKLDDMSKYIYELIK